MKLNLNTYIMSSPQYLSHVFDMYNGCADEYNYFIKNYHIKYKYLLPYIYTFSKLTNIEIDRFKNFYVNYLEKSNIEIDISNKTDIFETISQDYVLIVTFIIAMQYYFL